MTLNRDDGRSAAAVNLDGAAFGFKVTGDAAWDSGSDDFAMFSDDGNLAVACMVARARSMQATGLPADDVTGWMSAETERLAANDQPHIMCRHHWDEGGPRAIIGYGEIYDTMVRETIAYALDEAWLAGSKDLGYGYRCPYEG